MSAPPDPAQALHDLVEAAALRLRADPWFTPSAPDPAIEVLTEQQGDLDSLIDQKIGALGICAVLITPKARLADPGVPVLELDPVRLDVQVTELPLLNRDVAAGGTGKAALSVVVRAMQVLHHAPHGVGFGRGRLGRWEACEDPYTLVSASPALIYLVHFQAPLRLPADAASDRLFDGPEPLFGLA